MNLDEEESSEEGEVDEASEEESSQEYQQQEDEDDEEEEELQQQQETEVPEPLPTKTDRSRKSRFLSRSRSPKRRSRSRSRSNRRARSRSRERGHRSRYNSRSRSRSRSYSRGRRGRSYSRSYSRSRSRSYSSSRSRSRTPSPRTRSPQVVQSEVDLNKIRLPREMFIKWIFEPFFEEIVKDTFVRVHIGANKAGQPVYRVARVVRVVPYRKQYTLPGTTVHTKKGLELQVGKSKRAFSMDYISNSRITEEEFKRYRRDWFDAGLPLIKMDELMMIRNQIQKTTKGHKYTEAEVQRMVQARADSMGMQQSNLREQVHQLSAQIMEKKTQKDDINNKLKNLEEREKSINNKLEELTRRLQTCEDQIHSLEIENDELIDQQKQNNDIIVKIKDKLDREMGSDERETLEDELLVAEGEINRIDNEMERVDNDLVEQNDLKLNLEERIQQQEMSNDDNIVIERETLLEALRTLETETREVTVQLQSAKLMDEQERRTILEAKEQEHKRSLKAVSERNRLKNIKAMTEVSLTKGSKKGDFNPFERQKCRPQILWGSNGATEEKKTVEKKKEELSKEKKDELRLAAELAKKEKMKAEKANAYVFSLDEIVSKVKSITPPPERQSPRKQPKKARGGMSLSDYMKRQRR
eukprot:TRINITY_DN2880_c0_g1_i1.p1 TRINITY_DN2880_c0_g1~~TRINITY_DN2880_c0_g1_i1.p1  ORF type:complete len:641 (-),score=221.79 TRINITY_DN2880_c0_g1_i1:438-2360(-)